MAKVHILEHPLIQHKLAILRSKDTPVKEFRELVGEIAGLMCYEATRNLPTEEVTVETPITTAKCRMLSGKKLAIVPVLRAGLGMVDSMVALIPSAKIGHIGLYRDPQTHKPVEYYCKLPEDIENRVVFVVDPMLATGGSAVAAIDFLKQHGYRLPGGCGGSAESPSGCGDLPGGPGRKAQRARLHCPRPGRRRRSDLRHQVRPGRSPKCGREKPGECIRIAKYLHNLLQRPCPRDIIAWNSDFGENVMLLHYFLCFLVSMVPLIELRGAIPYAVGMGLDYFTALGVCVIGNMLPVPIIYLFARKVLHWGMDKKYIGKFFTFCVNKGERAGQKLTERAGRSGLFLALLLFVGIPLPGTGAWTGTLAASFLDMGFKSATLAVCLGVVLAGIIMGVVSVTGVHIFGL